MFAAGRSHMCSRLLRSGASVSMFSTGETQTCSWFVAITLLNKAGTYMAVVASSLGVVLCGYSHGARRPRRASSRRYVACQSSTQAERLVHGHVFARRWPRVQLLLGLQRHRAHEYASHLRYTRQGPELGLTLCNKETRHDPARREQINPLAVRR